MKEIRKVISYLILTKSWIKYKKGKPTWISPCQVGNDQNGCGLPIYMYAHLWKALVGGALDTERDRESWELWEKAYRAKLVFSPCKPMQKAFWILFSLLCVFVFSLTKLPKLSLSFLFQRFRIPYEWYT